MIVKKGSGPKKIIMVVIDSLRPRSLAACIRREQLPGLKFLKQHGLCRDDCVSVFPTMTPTCTATIATGLFPDQHEVPGFIWYNREENRYIDYGATWKSIFRLGLTRVLTDLIYNLNKSHLNSKVKTIYEILEDAGFSSTIVNFFTYRGYHSFPVNVPWWMNLLTGGKLKGEVPGPERLILGRAVPPRKKPKGPGLKSPDSIFHKYGINDEFSGSVTHSLIKEGCQPALTVVYLPDTDGYTHRHHTAELAPSLVQADRQVQKILNAFPSWEKALEECIFIVTGDHAQSLVGKKRQSLVKLGDVLSGFTHLPFGAKYAGQQLALCPNERMGFIYFLQDRNCLLEPVVKKLMLDPRIDQIIWREEIAEGETFCVRRGGEKSLLRFSPGGPYHDVYGQNWYLEGDPGVLDLTLSDDDTVSYGNYPDALQVISTLMRSRHAGDIAVSAKPGFEVDGEVAPTHRGKGSHGSFHRDDILVPVIIAGDDVEVKNPRIADFAPYILQNFGLQG